LETKKSMNHWHWYHIQGERIICRSRNENGDEQPFLPGIIIKAYPDITYHKDAVRIV